ncbi:MAG: amidohydrolase [Ruminococcaceae bacterium]|nr:amidohydrolase [Oscillospiraceae bacterium]
MEYIDFHAHIFPDKVAPKAVGKLATISGITPFTDGTLSDTLSKMATRDISRFVCLNIATAPGQENTINRTAKDVTDAHPGKIVSLGSVHPDSPDWEEQLENIKSFGIPGIKLHPDYQNFMIEDKRLYPIYEKCAELDLFIVFHSGWDCYSPDKVHAYPECSAKVAKDNPKLKMVLAHFGGLRMWEQVKDHLIGLENVYLDTAMCATYKLDKAAMAEMIKNHPQENVFLGSDCPWEDPGESVKYIHTIPISDDAKERIFNKNSLEFIQQYGLWN